MEAVQSLRETKGRSLEPRSLFTTSASFRSEEIRFIANLVVNREVQDDFGVAAKAATSSLEYTLAFRVQNGGGAERLELVEESLLPTPIVKARKDIGFPASKEFKDSCLTGRRAQPFVSTRSGDIPTITVHQEGHGGRTLPAPKSSRTIVGGMASSDFPTILAVNKEFLSWKSLLLEPSAMRAPSLYTDSKSIDARGGNLPAAIFRLQGQENNPGEIYASLTNRLAELIDDVLDLRVKDDEKTETLTLEVKGKDGVFHPARSLSDGTLRFLVLATLSLDPETRGVICLEEPENGIHPERIDAMVRLLRDVAVDSNYPVSNENPLRQVIVNTHSPEVVNAIANLNDLIYLEEERTSRYGRIAVPTAPENSWRNRIETTSGATRRGRLAPYFRNRDLQTWFDFTREPRAEA